MFTGIVEATGEVTALDLRGGDVRLRIRANSLDLSKIQLGDSIATNGVC
jgi:riboflavin synthase